MQFVLSNVFARPVDRFSDRRLDSAIDNTNFIKPRTCSLYAARRERL